MPSASRAACGGLAVDDESIPRRPPYTAHISNLPYDVDESAIYELFTGLKVKIMYILVININPSSIIRNKLTSTSISSTKSINEQWSLSNGISFLTLLMMEP